MDAITLGPFMLPAGTLYLVAALLLFFAGVELAQWRLKKRAGKVDLSRWSQHCLWGGLAAGRLGYVVQYPDSYRHDLLSVLYFWQPGYSVSAAVLAAAAITLWQLRRQRRLLTVSLGWLVLCTLAWLLLSRTDPLRSGHDQPIPSLTLPMLQQAQPAAAVDLSQQNGTVLLNLWASWCGPCRRELPALVHFAADYPHVNVWLVNQGESPLQIRRFLETRDQSVPERLILLDPNQSLMQAIRGVGLPITLVYHNGRLVESHTGEVSHARLREMVQTAGNLSRQH